MTNQRFTPAYAGKIDASGEDTKKWRVHPRIRGEDKRTSRQLAVLMGSPPHTRGRFKWQKARDCMAGFTPAYAGKILPKRIEKYSSEVHPRIRGEDFLPKDKADQAQGSPPHTRGRFHEINPHGDFIRFTPAYAGKISSRVNSLYMRRVHPRIRGEDSSSTVSASSAIGSPPHTRGRSVLFMPSSISLRFTPAYAGKISASSAVITSP